MNARLPESTIESVAQVLMAPLAWQNVYLSGRLPKVAAGADIVAAAFV